MIIDMNNAPKVLTLGDLESGDVFQFPLNPSDYYMSSSAYSKSGDQRKYINLSTGEIYGGFTHEVVKKVNARLTNKVD
ncbi:hypothetical protein AVV18_gp006 [Escherichia phage 172-1]|uniref:Uncharacterized protein n=1 Tax=Escherichia phage 172-1 TaxID=1598146 RepID=A0A0D5BI12_9CAUD|nr:hypothetical protein AVV18_gp006 [Escherichia phage 172-1]AJW61371.1 hypothetical protein 1721_7 [Escherichia phage 172-1]